jgi:hypothetical protein
MPVAIRHSLIVMDGHGSAQSGQVESSFGSHLPSPQEDVMQAPFRQKPSKQMRLAEAMLPLSLLQ